MADDQTPQEGHPEHEPSQEELDHHANQHNPNNPAFRDRINNHAEQLNPNNPKYQQSRKED
jgi:hypothetical protein